MRIIFLSFILLVILAIIFSKSTLRAIILLSVFSMISSLMYYLYQAPDVAMAELAIGAAIVPLIYVISITRQKKYIVVNNTQDHFLDHGMAGYMLLAHFCKQQNLDLVILDEAPTQETFLFSRKDIDLIVDVDKDYHGQDELICSTKPSDKRYVFKGSPSSYIFHALVETLQQDPCSFARIMSIEEEETHD